jgi:hypothetical protein
LVDLPVPTTSGDRVREVTESVLARPEFLQAQPSWLQRALRWLADLFSRFTDALGGGERGSTIGTVSLIVVLLILALGILWYTRTLRRDRTLGVAVEGAVGRGAEDWLRDAAAAEAAGDFRGALRCRYRAMVAELAAHGLVEEVPGRTTGEYLAAVSQDVPAAAAAFTVATRAFEGAWYGHDDVTAADVSAFAETARDVARDSGIRRTAALVGAP